MIYRKVAEIVAFIHQVLGRLRVGPAEPAADRRSQTYSAQIATEGPPGQYRTRELLSIDTRPALRTARRSPAPAEVGCGLLFSPPCSAKR